MPSKEEEELLVLAKNLVALIEDEKSHEKNEFYTIINQITKILGPSYYSIPSDLKKALGVAYGSTLAETETAMKAAYTRSTLSLLRAAVKLARGPQKQIDEIDKYIKDLEKEVSICEQSEEPLLDELWKKTNRILDYISLLIFSGYGEIRGEGFKFTKKEEIKEITQNDTKRSV